jgi:hypothetical protein
MSASTTQNEALERANAARANTRALDSQIIDALTALSKARRLKTRQIEQDYWQFFAFLAVGGLVGAIAAGWTL